MQQVLLAPLRTRLDAWAGGKCLKLHDSSLELTHDLTLDLTSGPEEEHDDDCALQLQILGMWVERVQGAIDNVAV